MRRTVVVVPTLLLIVAGLVTLIGCSMTVTGAVKTGIFADDPVHVRRLTEYIRSGLYVTHGELGAVKPGAIPDNAYVYGPVTTGLAHEISVLTGIEPRGEAERTPRAYLVRHLVVAGLGLIGLAAAAALGAIVLGSWRWGVVTAGVLAAIPMWTGHAMFNLKDTPVAAGHTLVTLGFVLIAKAGEHPRISRLAPGVLALSAGAVVVMGTRPGMWVSLTASLIAFLVLLVWTQALQWRALAAVGASVMIGYLALLAIYPRAFSHPLVLLQKSALVSAGFQHATDHGRLYQVHEMFHVWPLTLLGFLIVGTVGAIHWAWRDLRARSVTAVALILVGSQAYALPIMIMIRNSHLYNGLRQTLFAVPAQAVLVAVGIAAVVGASKGIGPRTWRIGGSVVAIVGLILPTAVQVAMFPYQYSYMNVEAEPHEKSTQPDFFKTSFREYVPEVSSSVKLVCPKSFTHRTVLRSGSDCRRKRSLTFSAYWRFDGKPSWDLPKSNEFYAILPGSMRHPRHCRKISSVTRWQNLKRVTMSRLFECKPPATPENTPEQEPVDPFDPGWKG